MGDFERRLNAKVKEVEKIITAFLFFESGYQKVVLAGPAGLAKTNSGRILLFFTESRFRRRSDRLSTPFAV